MVELPPSFVAVEKSWKSCFGDLVCLPESLPFSFVSGGTRSKKCSGEPRELPRARLVAEGKEQRPRYLLLILCVHLLLQTVR